MIASKQYERKHRYQVSPYGTFLSLGNPYPMDILVCCKLCKSSCSLFGKHVGSAIVGIGRTFLPMFLTIILVFQRQELRKDFLGRFLNVSSGKWQYYLTACLLLPASILCAMAISLLFGYSPSQFIITGHYTFTSGVFPVWFLLILAPTLEELAWHGMVMEQTVSVLE